MDPLILCGEPVVPIVLSHIGDKELSRRFAAIQFLGNGRYSAALPILREILNDNEELSEYRAVALDSIFLIDKSSGKELAKEYAPLDDELGLISKHIEARGQSYFTERTYWQALTRYHE
ncbi:hypothetical protein [Polystyrenella longa]|nr:hypothetical protein [Polystyrenella longa]